MATSRKKAPAKKAASKKPAAKKSSASKAPAKKAAPKTAAKKSSGGSTRKPNAAFMKAMTPSPALGAVVGTSPMPRTEITKRLWAYIKKNNLQDAENKRMVNADDKLKQIFNGRKQVSMFEMTKMVNSHLS